MADEPCPPRSGPGHRRDALCLAIPPSFASQKASSPLTPHSHAQKSPQAELPCPVSRPPPTITAAVACSPQSPHFHPLSARADPPRSSPTSKEALRPGHRHSPSPERHLRRQSPPPEKQFREGPSIQSPPPQPKPWKGRSHLPHAPPEFNRSAAQMGAPPPLPSPSPLRKKTDVRGKRNILSFR